MSWLCHNYATFKPRLCLDNNEHSTSSITTGSLEQQKTMWCSITGTRWSLPYETFKRYLFQPFPPFNALVYHVLQKYWIFICQVISKSANFLLTKFFLVNFDKVFVFLTKYFCLFVKYIFISGYLTICKFPFDKVASSSPTWSLHHILWPRWFQVFTFLSDKTLSFLSLQEPQNFILLDESRYFNFDHYRTKVLSPKLMWQKTKSL